ncbi:MAG: NAD-dependent protein deacetylase [Spirochaetota bacterium]
MTAPEPAQRSQTDRLATLLRDHLTCVLTGAGISTESGIPDYRGPAQRGKPATPITFREFVASTDARRRYWARSAIGWPWMARREPNEGHHVVAALERAGICNGVITQNVDGLHQAAGTRRIVELHGALRRALCLDCSRAESRESLQERMLVQNPGWMRHAGEVAPDGDVHLTPEVTAGFRVPACLHCGGTLKPDVVFFGENVPRPRVDVAFSFLEEADALLVLGSSLTVFSGYRFVVAARKQAKPVVIVNDGPTRADHDAALKLEVRLGEALTRIRSELELF